MKIHQVLAAGAGLLCVYAAAEPLPQPLSLEYALTLAEEPHPDLQLQLAELGLARAQRDETAAQLNFDAKFVADGRWAEPSTSEGQSITGDSRFSSNNDSRLHLILSKRLYDFGQSEARLAAADARQQAQTAQLSVLKGKRRLAIMRDYFEVLLADLEYAEANEAMAIEYVRLERMQDRNELQQTSDVQLAEQQHRYQSKRVKRYKAQARQRTSRAKLAETLNRPGQLPSDVMEPKLDIFDRTLPELETWLDQARHSNPSLLASRAEGEAAREQLRAARFGNRPVLSGELRASDYAREFTTRDKYRANLLLEVPLYSGGRLDAQRAEALARLQKVEARTEQLAMELRQALTEAWERIGVLQAQRDQAVAELDFRDLDLDRARTLYELEAQADLGNSMSDYSAARLRRAQAEYQLALTWAEIALLTGHPEWDPFGQGSAAAGSDSVPGHRSTDGGSPIGAVP